MPGWEALLDEKPGIFALVQIHQYFERVFPSRRSGLLNVSKPQEPGPRRSKPTSLEAPCILTGPEPTEPTRVQQDLVQVGAKTAARVGQR